MATGHALAFSTARAVALLTARAVALSTARADAFSTALAVALSTARADAFSTALAVALLTARALALSTARAEAFSTALAVALLTARALALSTARAEAFSTARAVALSTALAVAFAVALFTALAVAAAWPANAFCAAGIACCDWVAAGAHYRDALAGIQQEQIRRGNVLSPEDRQAQSLSERELAVLELIAEGLTNREMGERLFLSEKTIKHHVSDILSKLGLSRRVEAATFAIRRRAQHPDDS